MHYTCLKQLINEENISVEVRQIQNMIEGLGYKKPYSYNIMISSDIKLGMSWHKYNKPLLKRYWKRIFHEDIPKINDVSECAEVVDLERESR